jgi:hypothetical protein
MPFDLDCRDADYRRDPARPRAGLTSERERDNTQPQNFLDDQTKPADRAEGSCRKEEFEWQW